MRSFQPPSWISRASFVGSTSRDAFDQGALASSRLIDSQLKSSHRLWASFATLSCCAGLLLGGCASQSQMERPGQLDLAVKNAAHTAIDPEIERSSAALHSYLVGELSYTKENFDDALKSFSRTSELISEPEPIVYAKLAELYLRDGDLEKALAESKRALEARPDDEQTRLLQAGILEALDRDAEAEPLYRALIAQSPDSVEPYIYLSGLLLRRNEAVQSLEVLHALEARGAKTAMAYYYLGRAYEERGELAIAEKHLLKAREEDPQRINYAIDLIRVLLKQKKLDRSKQLCKEILEKDPDNVTARKILGQLLLGENNFDEALSHLQVLEGVEQDPTETRFKIALIQIEKQNVSEAIRELSLILAKNPDHVEARYYLGSAYASAGQRKEGVAELLRITPGQKMFIKSRTLAAFLLRQDGDIAGAEQAVREALTQEPGNRQLLDYLVLILRDGQKFADAERLLNRAIELAPQDERLLLSYGIVLNDLGRREEAEAVMERVIAINPKNAEALNFVAYSLAERSLESEKALQYVQRALAADPDNGFYLDTLGWIYYQGGNYATAVDTLGRAVAAVSDDLVLLEHYADALLKTGEIAKAIRVYQTALEKEVRKGDREQSGSHKSIEKKLQNLRQHYPEMFGAGR